MVIDPKGLQAFSKMNQQIEILNQAITEKGHRLTTARRQIIESLVDTNGHLTADELAVRVRQHAPQIGRMTVYRTLELLSELGVIRPIYQGTGAAHYVLMADGSHHHLICNRCHKVIEFDDCFADEITHSLSQKFGFQVQSHLLELHGLCAECG